MGFPFAEAEKRTTANAAEFPLTSYFLTGMRSGRFVVSGIPITMPPAELFTSERAALTHIFSFRLVRMNPRHYTLSFSCFDEGGLMFNDFSVLIEMIDDFLSDVSASSEAALASIVASTPIEGAFIMFYPDGEDDDDASLEVITLYPPNMCAEVFNTTLNEALWQGIRKGFADHTA